EAKPKGKLAETGRNTGEIRNTPAEDQKKPEENKNYAAALKNQKEQRNQKAAAPEAAERNQKAAAPEAAERALSPEGGVTVYFHAIVSRDFKFN
ncbi:E3 ubiquitin-protein ligase RNF213, partial [Lemmus lemmus]